VRTAARRQHTERRQPRHELGVVERYLRAEGDAAQRIGEVSRGLEAIGGGFGERLVQHVAHAGRQVGAVAFERRAVGLVNLGQNVELVLPREQRAGDQHLGQDDADREQIAARIDLHAHHLLGRHVADLALELARIGPTVDVRATHDAEVGQLHVAGAADQHVAG
jgi:hypothetical protein